METLTIEQMRHLEELGVDITDANMLYNHIDKNPCLIYADFNINWEEVKLNKEPILPTYTLQDIWNKLNEARLFIWSDGFYFYAEDYKAEGIGKTIMHEEKAIGALLLNAYNMLCWCIMNGYIKK